MSNLVELATHRDDLLLAEIGAWLHNFGKYSEAFLYSQFADAGNTAYIGSASYLYQHIVRGVADIYTVPASNGNIRLFTTSSGSIKHFSC